MITIIVPYYRNPKMLATQLENWALLPDAYRFVIVDDGSPEPALNVIADMPERWQLRGDRLRLYRVGIDIPWNRGGARNLGAHVAETDWIFHMDIDHLLPYKAAMHLLTVPLIRDRWYKFRRFRIGRADDTRRKDRIPDSAEFGEIHPHMDSYLITKDLYWKNGGYDEDYSGCLGGGTPFVQSLEKLSPALMAPPDVYLHVYTRSMVPDASDWALSRDTGDFYRRKEAKRLTKNTFPKNPLRFPWERVL